MVSWFEKYCLTCKHWWEKESTSIVVNGVVKKLPNQSQCGMFSTQCATEIMEHPSWKPSYYLPKEVEDGVTS